MKHAQKPNPFTPDELDRHYPQTEDSRERGFVVDDDEDAFGRSEALDPDDVGDIADEGTGRRG
jgi:hypothetical protein